MALTFTLQGVTNHEMTYLVEGTVDGDIDAAGAAGPPADLLTDTMPGTPLRAFMSQVVDSQDAARQICFNQDFDGENSVKVQRRLIGTVQIQGRTGAVAWDVDADTDGADHLRLSVATSDIEGDGASAWLRIRVRHTFDR